MRFRHQMSGKPESFWGMAPDALFKQLGTGPKGLTDAEAKIRRAASSADAIKVANHSGSLLLFLGQFKSPIIIILLCATVLSLFLQNYLDAVIILAIVLISGGLGFWQEHSASDAVKKLIAMIQVRAKVLRDGVEKDVPVDEVVAGDIVVLSAGSLVPGDSLILESNDLYADEAMLSGETFPVEKLASTLPADSALAQRSNSLWMGTNIISGSARAVVALTGADTEFGKVSQRLKLKPAETDFEHGVRKFGFFLGEITLVMVVLIFAINVFLHRPILDSFLFSLALAVGLTPQLLPAIISINLARGARRMAAKKVIVKRLASIENFGSMNVLCSDKTGTLTEGKVEVKSAWDIDGKASDKTFLYAYLNASFETGFSNPIDEAIRSHSKPDIGRFTKQDEVPYDFIRKRLSVAVADADKHILISKGAMANVLEVCRRAEKPDGTVVDIESVRDQIQKCFSDASSQGLRTLGIAYKNLLPKQPVEKKDETEMVFLGFVTLLDPPKADAGQTIDKLKNLGVSLKVITGDNRLVAAALGERIGLSESHLLTGSEMMHMSDDALLKRVGNTMVFAEIEPNQKERIIVALRKAGNVVGYMGDGINDASALHAADIGISVDSAADIAKEAADIILLEKDLRVLVEGVREGRTTFANTLKYVFMATSANFGNMFSMAGISLFIPFLPLLPKQILLTNLMTDFPEMTIATDNTDEEMVNYPRRWNIKAIRTFMVSFGLLSSIFDYLTFGLLLVVLGANEAQFRTGWFVESVVSASLIVLVIRSRRPFFKSKPSGYLLLTTLSVVAATIILPLTPLGTLFDLAPLGFWTYLSLFGVIVVYIGAAEIVKRLFYKSVKL